MGLGSILTQVGKAATGKYALPIAAGGSLLSGLLNQSQGARTSTAGPTTPPAYAGLSDLLRQRTEDRLRSTMDMGGYEANGLQNINDAYARVEQGLNANLTARGLSTSPVAASALTNLQSKRGGSVVQFLNTLPQVQRDMQAQDIGLANQVLNPQMGQQQTAAGSPLGAGIDNLATYLGYLHDQQSNGGGGTAGKVASTATDIASFLPSLFGAGGAASTGALSAEVAGLAGLTPASVLGSGAAAASVGGGTAAGGGLGATVGAFLTNPITIAAGAALGIGLLVRKAQAHHKADEWVHGTQNDFDKQMAAINQNPSLSPQNKMELKKAAVADYFNAAKVFAAKGSDQARVIQQAMNTFRQWYGNPAQYGVS